LPEQEEDLSIAKARGGLSIARAFYSPPSTFGRLPEQEGRALSIAKAFYSPP